MEGDPNQPEQGRRAAAEDFARHYYQIDRDEGMPAASRFQEYVLTPLPKLDLEAAVELYVGLATSTDPHMRVIACSHVHQLYLADREAGAALWLQLLEDFDQNTSDEAYNTLTICVDDGVLTPEEAEPFESRYIHVTMRRPWQPPREIDNVEHYLWTQRLFEGMEKDRQRWFDQHMGDIRGLPEAD